MLNAVWWIGKIMGEGHSEVEKMVSDVGEAYTKELAVILEEKNGEFEYVKCDLREKGNRKYLFREKKGNIKIPWSLTLRDSGKKISGKVVGSKVIIDKFIEFGNKNSTPIASKVSKAISNSKNEIISSLNAISSKIDKKSRKFYTVVIKSGNKEMYPGDVDEFGKIFIENVTKVDNEHDGICYLCGEKKKIGMKVSEIFSGSVSNFVYPLNPEKKNHK